MVSKPTQRFRLPATPLPVGAQIEASFALWLASSRRTFLPALAYGLAGWLPLLTLDDLLGRALRATLAEALAPYRAWLPLPGFTPDAGWLAAVWQWFTSPATWSLLLAALLLALAAVTLLIRWQHDVASADPAPAATAVTRIPAGVGAWLVYAGLLLVLTLPLLGFTAVVLVFGQVADLTGLVLLLLGFLAGALVLVVPLTWAAVAAGFAPFAAAIDGVGPIAAQRRSIARVRGHWVPAAIVISVPMLIYLGAGGLVSSLTLLACGGAAYAIGGIPALLQGAWLGWAHWLGLVPMALLLPLAFAGGVVAWNDLGLRAAGVGSNAIG